MSNQPSPRLDQLPSFNEQGEVLAVIEASRGSRNKLKFDAALGTFVLHGVLPSGLVYPCDFGFVPSTLADDGDPLDILVLTDEPAPVSAVVPCRLLGVLVAEQSKGRQMVRNDRLLAAAVHSQRHADIRALKDMAGDMLRDIERFFIAHNEARGERFEPHGRFGAARALAVLREAAKRAANPEALSAATRGS